MPASAGFTRDLHRGGLARRLLAPESLRAARGADQRASEPAQPEPAAPGGTTHVSVIDADGNAAALSTSTGSGSGVIVPGTGIYLNNMLGEYDLVGGRPPRPGSAAHEHDGADDRARRRRRARASSSAAPARRGSAARSCRSSSTCSSTASAVEDAIGAPRIHVDEPHVHCEGGHDPAELDRLARARLRRRPLAAPEPLLRRRRRRRGASRRLARRPRATPAGAVQERSSDDGRSRVVTGT